MEAQGKRVVGSTLGRNCYQEEREADGKVGTYGFERYERGAAFASPPYHACDAMQAH